MPHGVESVPLIPLIQDTLWYAELFSENDYSARP